MKKVFCLALLLSFAGPKSGATPPAQNSSPVRTPLPAIVLTELRALEETYVLLDAVAEKVWPGWSGYRDWPFEFTFDNGIRVLVGHPNPPKEFQVIGGLRVGGNAVAVDRSHETPLALNRPLSAGGGLIALGSRPDGTPVDIVNIGLRMPRTAADAQSVAEEVDTAQSETKILVYLHELFHGFQRRFVTARVGNLMYNADLEYAVWSNIEGIALDRAYAATDSAAAKERVKDFLVARALKRRSMTAMQQKQESSDDVLEGTATYAMVRALEVIKAGGFRSKLAPSDDPEYHGFAKVDALIDDYRKRLRDAAGEHQYPKMKCYDYGCFQALLAERLTPGWQGRVQKGEFIDAILAGTLTIADADRVSVEERLQSDYPVAQVRADAAKFIDGRDAAWAQLKARTGRTYIVDLKGTGTYPPPPPKSATAYRLGIMTLFPAAFPGVKLDEVEMSATTVPAMTDQIYYVKVVDTQPAAHKQAYAVAGTKLPDGTYANAVVTTPVFTLKAPKVRIKETSMRVKIQVLARVSPAPGTTH